MDFSLIVLAIVAIVVILNLGKILSGIIKLVVRLLIAGAALYVGYLIYIGQLQFSI
jgi:hypothetical protein